MSTNSYIRMRRALIKNSVNVLPSYPVIKRARAAVIPPTTRFSDLSAKVPLQDLLNVTAAQIIKLVDNVTPNSLFSATLIKNGEWMAVGAKYVQATFEHWAG